MHTKINLFIGSTFRFYVLIDSTYHHPKMEGLVGLFHIRFIEPINKEFIIYDNSHLNK